MQFTNAIAAAILAVTVAAAPTAKAPTGPFGSLALRSASPIMYEPLVARGLKIYLGGKSATYCPPEVKPNCPPGKTTAFIVDDASGTAAMDVEVPGGQQLYIAPDGSLSYTQAHSDSIPTGSVTTGFNRSPNEKGESFGFFTHKAGFVACEISEDNYQVFAATKGFNKKGCLGFEGTASKYDNGSAAAWQYT